MKAKLGWLIRDYEDEHWVFIDREPASYMFTYTKQIVYSEVEENL
jgi:hypothetical protein